MRILIPAFLGSSFDLLEFEFFHEECRNIGKKSLEIRILFPAFLGSSFNLSEFEFFHKECRNIGKKNLEIRILFPALLMISLNGLRKIFLMGVSETV